MIVGIELQNVPYIRSGSLYVASTSCWNCIRHKYDPPTSQLPGDGVVDVVDEEESVAGDVTL
jgi:hypothetical protein